MKRSPSLTAWMLAVAAGMALPTIVAAQENKPVVAVLYFDNNSIGKDRADYDGLGKGVADLLITDLSGNSAVKVVDRDQIQKLLQEQNLIKTGAVDATTAVRLGKLIGAQYMITGGFMNTGKQMVLTARAINVETGQITNPQKVQSGGDDVLGLIAQLSSKVSTDMKLPAMSRHVGQTKPAGAEQAGQEVAQAKPVKLDMRTALLYSKALDEADNGNKPKAAELFKQVLSKFPDFGPAKSNLQKVQSGD